MSPLATALLSVYDSAADCAAAASALAVAAVLLMLVSSEPVADVNALLAVVSAAVCAALASALAVAAVLLILVSNEPVAASTDVCVAYVALVIVILPAIDRFVPSQTNLSPNENLLAESI